VELEAVSLASEAWGAYALAVVANMAVRREKAYAGLKMKSPVTLQVEAPAATIDLFKRIEDDVAAANTAVITYTPVNTGETRYIVTPRQETQEASA
jgi:hypothetical protein